MSATCRTCGGKYSEFGDGWDGECPDCADRRYAQFSCHDCNEEFETSAEMNAHIDAEHNEDYGVVADA